MALYRDRTPPEQQAAHNAISKAKKNGTLQRQPCERCGATKNVHAHHEDYSKPLDVVWLCRTHHAERHRELIIEGGLPITRAKTGYRGVDLDEHGTYRAMGALNGRTFSLGIFPSPEEAARAFDQYAIKLHGASALLNFPAEAAA